MHQYFRFPLLGNSNWNDESYKSHVTSMLQKQERNISHRFQKIPTFGNWKNQFPQSYSKTSMLQKQEQLAKNEEVTFVKRQLEKLVSLVVHQTSMLQK